MQGPSAPEPAPTLFASSYAKLDSHQRMLDRMQVREEHAKEEAARSQERLLRRRRASVDDRVERAAQKLKGANVPTTVGVIQGLSTVERDFYLLAEEHLGLNRKSVLKLFPKPRKSIREAFLRGTTPTEPREAEEAQPEAQAQTEE